MKVKTEIKIVISSMTSNGNLRFYTRHAEDCSKAEDIVNRFILNTRTRLIRVLMYEGNGLWKELSLFDCRVPQSKYKLPL